ncbi:hypothetical protein TNCT_227291, partial [Trichonephila clavata]
TVWNNCASE